MHDLFFFYKYKETGFDLISFLVFNETFSNITAVSWRPVLVVEEVGVPGENPRVECTLL